MKSKLRQAIEINIKYKQLHDELYGAFCSASDKDRTKLHGKLTDCSIAHHNELKSLGYRHRDLDMDGFGPIKDSHAEGRDSKHWLIRITKSWIAHRKRRRLLADAVTGFQSSFMVVKVWKEVFPHYMDFKRFDTGSVEKNFEIAEKIQRFMAMETTNFEKAWKKLGLDKDISRVWRDEPKQETRPQKVQRRRVRSRRA